VGKFARRMTPSFGLRARQLPARRATPYLQEKLSFFRVQEGLGSSSSRERGDDHFRLDLIILTRGWGLIQIKKIFGSTHLKIFVIKHLHFTGLAKILAVKDLLAKYCLLKTLVLLYCFGSYSGVKDQT
jgi:hypothetical protein